MNWKPRLWTMATSTALALGATVSMAEESESVQSGVQPLVPAAPTSIESMIERRRDLLDRRRNAYTDARTGRRWYRAPWENAHHDWMDRMEDIMRESFRQRRDLADARRDAWGRWSHPWSQATKEWNKARRNARELDRLVRDEYYENRYLGGPWGGYGPYW